MIIEDFIKKSQEMSLSAKGGNKECFYIEGYALLKDNGIEEQKLQRRIEIEKLLKEKGVNIALTLEYTVDSRDADKEFKRGYILQEKAEKEPLHKTENLCKMSKEETDRVGDEYINRLNMLKDEHPQVYNKFVSDWIEIVKSGLRVDPSKTSNFYYKSGEQISFIDLGLNERFKGEIDLGIICVEIATVLADGVKYNYSCFKNNQQIRENANKALSSIFKKLTVSLVEQGMNKEKATQILKSRFPEVDLNTKDTRGQVYEQAIGLSQEQEETHPKDKGARKRTEEQMEKFKRTTSGQTVQRMSGQALKKDIARSKITTSETNQEMSDLQKRQKAKALWNRSRQEELSPEDKELLKENERQRNQAIVDYRNMQDNKKRANGVEI